MKKIILVLAVFLVFGGIISAEGTEGPVRLDFSSGLYYDAFPFQTTDGLQILEAIFNLRFGGHLGLGFNLSENMRLGVEAGVLAFSWETDSYYYTLLDLPFRGYFDLHAGEDLSLRAFGGGIVIMAIGNGIASVIVPEAGARVSLGGFYIEAAYVFSNNPIQRFGLGFTGSLF
ncbi:MAG: hypothetical protein JEZ04_10575 [Spirochaetales bacterium]|nr:hypothetical protein [Spirochaetales bacterium]